jgi:hypothetical protein
MKGLYVRGDAQPCKLTARQHLGETELCSRRFARDQDRRMRNAWLVIHVPPMTRCERIEVASVAPHASANISFKRHVSKVPQAPAPPQIDVEGGEAVPSLPRYCFATSRTRRGSVLSAFSFLRSHSYIRQTDAIVYTICHAMYLCDVPTLVCIRELGSSGSCMFATSGRMAAEPAIGVNR